MWKKSEKPAGYASGGEILLIPTGEIAPNPEQPRREFDYDALVELARSIAENGLLNPLSVSLEEGRPVLVAGERRLRAARMLGMREVPCVVVKDAAAERRAVLALIENMQRVDMNCFEEAEAIGRLIRDYGLTQEEAANRLGYSQPAIANKLRLLKLSPQLRQQMAAAGLSERHARALLRLENPAQQQQVLARILKEKLTVARTEQLVETLCQGPAPRTRRPILIVRDVRLFLNTVEHAVETMRAAGIEATWERRDTSADVEYVIHIPSRCFGAKPDKPARLASG